MFMWGIFVSWCNLYGILCIIKKTVAHVAAVFLFEFHLFWGVELQSRFIETCCGLV
jgi:hypothetical protein